MKRIIQSSVTIVAALALVAGASVAYFSDTERSAGNTFAAGVINLLVDNESYYNGVLSTSTTWFEPSNLDEGKLFFNFTDLKPDDEGEDTISLHVETNDAWACMNVELTSNDDISSNEPELLAGDAEENAEDPWDGELAGELQFLWWADDGDNVYEDDEMVLSDGVQTLSELALDNGAFQVALADSENNVWTDLPGALEAGETYYIGKAWCYGALTEVPLVQDGGDQGRSPIGEEGPGVVCDGTDLGNMTQTDGVTLDVSFLAMQARHDADYLCPQREQPPVACDIEQTYADEVVYADQGLRKDGTAVLASRSDTSYVLGAPQSLGTPYDNPVVPNSFFSLGFPLDGHTAEIILSFNDNYVVNATGTDLKLWEVTGGSSYPDERVDVYVGNTPVGPWIQVGYEVTRDAELDLGSVEAARYVRIVDASNMNLFESTADGYDLDAVQALNCIISPEQNGDPGGPTTPVAPVITEGEASMDEGAGVHYRSFTNVSVDGPDEIRLGANIQNNPQYNEQDIYWPHNNTSVLTFVYATDSDQLKTQVNDNPELTWDDISTNAQCPVGSWDTMQLSIKGEHNDALDIENLMVDGVLLGDFAGSTSEHVWTITGLSLSDGFTLVGNVVVTNPISDNGDGNNIKILVGCSV